MPYRVDVCRTDPACLDRLIDLGALDAEPMASGVVAAIMPDSITPEEVAHAAGVQSVTVSAATGRDGDSVWRLSLRPASVAGLRLVHDEGGGPASQRRPGELRLTDAPAFGTGLHPTTKMCLEMIRDITALAMPEAILDVGTGSGILALGALALGVPRACAVDIDRGALRAAAENGRLNGMDARLEVRYGGAEAAGGQWPLVVANILAAPLREMAPVLLERIGRQGQLILSGIVAGLGPDVTRTYEDRGLHLVEARTNGGWQALLLRAPW